MQIARYFAVGVEKTRHGEFVAGKSDEVLSAQSAVEKAARLPTKLAVLSLSNGEAT